MLKEFQNIKIQDLETVANCLKSLTEDFFQKNKRTCVIFLIGELGAGKTTLTKKLGEILGITEDIISPTFVLRKDYPNLIHVDGYRFEREEEGKDLYLERELGEENKILIIEWPERFVKAISLEPDIVVEIKALNESERAIKITENFTREMSAII